MIQLTAKKVYCPKCQKLCRIKEQRSGAKQQFLCIKCNHPVWQKQGLGWKFNKVD